MAVRLKADERLTCEVPGVAPMTVRVSATDCVILPDTPVKVTVLVPTVAVLPAVKVRMLAPAVDAGLNDAVTPVGRLVAERLTLPLNPFMGWSVTRTVSPPPTVRLSAAGVA